jgi:hypothetical protein
MSPIKGSAYATCIANHLIEYSFLHSILSASKSSCSIADGPRSTSHLTSRSRYSRPQDYNLQPGRRTRSFPHPSQSTTTLLPRNRPLLLAFPSLSVFQHQTHWPYHPRKSLRLHPTASAWKTTNGVPISTNFGMCPSVIIADGMTNSI